MPRGRGEVGGSATTKLAQARRSRGVTQQELADAVGVSGKTYWRLEHGRVVDPPLRLLSNCALALGMDLDDLIEDSWRDWYVLDQRRPTPPDPASFWRRRAQAG